VILGVAVQTSVNQIYIDDWQLRQDLLWQMRWRAPMVAPGTMYTLVTEPNTFAFGRILPDYELTAAASFNYAREDAPYPPIVGGGERGIREIILNDLPRSGVWSEVLSGRSILFMDWHFDLDNLLVFGYDGGCLRTANPAVAIQSISDSGAFNKLAPFHQSTQILDMGLEESGISRHQYVIAPEPEHGWCFYYQQIQWALQFNHNAEARRLADEARQRGLSPSDVVEWLPIIDAYNRAGAYEDAEALVMQIALSGFAEQPIACQYLESALSITEIQQQIDLLPGCMSNLPEQEKDAAPG
jgi:hypothetical protein